MNILDKITKYLDDEKEISEDEVEEGLRKKGHERPKHVAGPAEKSYQAYKKKSGKRKYPTLKHLT